MKYPNLQDKRIYVLKPEHMTLTVGPSETVPDDAMTIREIVNRYQSGMGIPPSKMHDARYGESANFDDPDLEEIARLDLADRHEMSELLKAENEEKTRELEAKIKAEKAAKAAKAAKKAEEATGKVAGTEPKPAAPTLPKQSDPKNEVNDAE